MTNNNLSGKVIATKNCSWLDETKVLIEVELDRQEDNHIFLLNKKVRIIED